MVLVPVISISQYTQTIDDAIRAWPSGLLRSQAAVSVARLGAVITILTPTFDSSSFSKQSRMPWIICLVRA